MKRALKALGIYSIYFPVQTIKAYRGSRGKAPFILNLGTSWRWVVNVTPRPLQPQKEPKFPLTG